MHVFISITLSTIMFNPFRSNNTVPSTTNEKTGNSPETNEQAIDRRKIGANIKKLLSLSTLALAHLFTPQAAEAKDTNQGVSEPSLIAASSQENSIEAKAYQNMLKEAITIQEGLFADLEASKAIDGILALAPVIDNPTGEVPHLDTGEDGTFIKDPFVNIKPLDLTLKKISNPNMFKVSDIQPKLDILSTKLSSKQYEATFLRLQEELKALEPIFASRPNFFISNEASKHEYRGEILIDGKYAGSGLLTKTKSDSTINTDVQGGNKEAIGNKEIYVTMKALEPLGKELGKRFSSMIGCDPQSVEANTKLLSSVHIDTDGKVNKTPYNNVHPTYTIEVCQKEHARITGNPVKTTPFLSIFNNSNGYGAPDLNKVRKVEETSVHIHDGYNPNLDKNWSSTQKAIQDTNRLIVTAGVKIDIPIPKTCLNFVPKLGVQYGYTIDGKKLTPMASFSLVCKKEGSSLDGFEIGMLPAGKRAGNSPNVIYFSTKYSRTF